MSGSNVIGQFNTFIPQDHDNSNPLTHQVLSNLSDAIFNAAVNASGTTIANSQSAGLIKVANVGYLSVAPDGTLVVNIGTDGVSPNTLVANNDSRFATYITESYILAGGYLTPATGVTSINGSVGTINLYTTNLLDVSTATPGDGQQLVYSAANSQYMPTSLNPVTSLSGLTDVSIFGPSPGQFLTYGNGQWNNQNFTSSNNPGLLYTSSGGIRSQFINVLLPSWCVPNPLLNTTIQYVVPVAMSILGVYLGIPNQPDGQSFTINISQIANGVPNQIGYGLVGNSVTNFTSFTPVLFAPGNIISVVFTAVTNGSLTTPIVGAYIQVVANYA